MVKTIEGFVSFLSHYFRNPQAVGAVSALSPAVARRLLKYVKARPDAPCKILEVGAGMGNITRPLVDLLRPGDLLDVVEIDQNCCQVLENSFQGDPRVCVRHLSIADWNPTYKYDFIISTLPFNVFPSDFLQNIITHYEELCMDNGMCAYVEYIGLQKISRLFSKQDKRLMIRKRSSMLKEYHKKYLIEKSQVFKNIFPCHVYHMQLSKNR